MKIQSMLAATLVLTAALSAQAQTVKVEFMMGKVNLTAQNASLRSIINEWARVGGMRVVNPERLNGPPVTLQLTGVAERQALDILLRDIGGYMLGPRESALVPGVSAFDRLVVITSTAGPASRPTPAAGVQRPPTANAFRRPIAPPPEPDADAVPEPEPDEPVAGGPPNRQNVRPAVLPPLPPTEAPPATTPPTNTPANPPTPGNPFGIQGGGRPGAVTPAPQNTTARPANE
jgi:septal ring-binding cell division protein DamX